MSAPVKVLIVDDEDLMVRVLTRMLEQGGHQVRSAPSAERGLELAAQERFAVVLLDNHLGTGMVGTQALVDFCNLCTAGVIMMTGYTTEGLEEDAKLLGAKAFLRKPIDPGVLLAAVDSLLPAP